MVIRCDVGGSVPRFSVLLAVTLSSALVSSALMAQAPSPKPSSIKPGAVAQPKISAPLANLDKPQDAVPVYGKIVVESAPLRCWASAVATPPAYEDVLKMDQIVRLGRSENGFREVMLPLGPMGYISERFTQAGEDGSVVTKGTKVAFRYRPRTSEAPVAQMPDGTRMHVIGLEDGWYKTRMQGVEAWVAEAEVQVVPSDPDVIAKSEALAEQMQAAVQVRLDAIAAERKQMEQNRIDLEAVKVVEAAFEKEMQKPSDEQQFGPLQEALAKVADDLAEDGVARTACDALQKRLKTQQWIVDAIIATTEKAPVSDVVEAKPVSKDRLERFESIGWLRYESRLAGPGIYYIEKGGRRQHLLSCNTGRFDLSLFVGREVGVIGPRRRPIGETLSVLDVERIEVLGAAHR
tara:strand:- start:76399 stop:77616 length:1218 start_codon:yes stop_codon:yes gene_type:complete